LRKHAYYSKEKEVNYMAYTRGQSTNIIVGAAALFTYEPGVLSEGDLPAYQAEGTVGNTTGTYRETLSNAASVSAGFRNVGYTMNGLELQFQPDFGEVQVDQVLDVAKLYKQGMQVNLNTAFAEATLENLLFSLAGKDEDLTASAGAAGIKAGSQTLNMSAGDIGECPVERGLVAVGPGTGDCNPDEAIERIYVAYRALSIESVTVSAKRDEPTMYEVSFRLLPNDTASYGKIVDRTIPAVS
jgi:hypothetical protein